MRSPVPPFCSVPKFIIREDSHHWSFEFLFIFHQGMKSKLKVCDMRTSCDPSMYLRDRSSGAVGPDF